jgi:hypothetical protein
MIEPIVEYLPIVHTESSRGAQWELFSIKDEDGKGIKYLCNIRKLMNDGRGIYIFYDSLGRAIYVGKAEKQSLWKEANLAFNRDRREHQAIWMVKHPKTNVSKEISNRKIRKTEVALSDIAAYFSAFSIEEGKIAAMEAFLIRAFANNLMNKRMETFRLGGGE